VLSCSKTDDPIDMQFVIKTWVGPRIHVLHGGPDPSRGRGNLGVFPPLKCIRLCNQQMPTAARAAGLSAGDSASS